MDQSPGNYPSEIIRSGAAWLSPGVESDVVVSSRVRLARNFARFPFLARATREHRAAIVDAARSRIQEASVADRLLWIEVEKIQQLDRTLLVERHLISKEHAKGPGGKSDGAPEPRAVAISLPDERLSIMVNEEDHLRIQVLRAGLDLSDACSQISSIDDRLDAAAGEFEFAYSHRFGYLTACPTNVGTGIRISVMLHLPGLRLLGELDKVKRAAADLSLAVRGYYGEGSDAAGDFFQLSNQTTLGKSEDELLHEFESQIIPRVILYERVARKQLVEKRTRLLEDKVFRALGLLRNARLLTPEEALSLLSDVRLGVLCNVIPDVNVETVNQLMLLTQPAHLQRALGVEMEQGQRREARADLVRKRLAPSAP